MLVNLQTTPRREGSGPIDLLLECHERIQRFSALATRLVTAQAPREQISDAAEKVLHYFRVAMPLHVEDEDQSVLPRLMLANPPQQVVDALGAMTREHFEIEALLAELSEPWSAIRAEPERRDSLRALPAASARLEELFRNHLASEEAIIFPAVRTLLSPQAQAEVVSEIRGRRAPK